MTDLIGARLQGRVGLAPKLVADDHEDDRRRDDDREPDGCRGDERQPGPKAHSSRSAYPTPRTVWISRGLPPASVLRRR